MNEHTTLCYLISPAMSEFIKTYSELSKLKTFQERFDYLKIGGAIGETTFGFNRYLNQMFYRSNPHWREIRDEVIIRDNGMDMGLDDFPIGGKIIVHHINPIREEDILNLSDIALSLENLVCVSLATHNAIHFGDPSKLTPIFEERKPGDTCPWRKGGY